MIYGTIHNRRNLRWLPPAFRTALGFLDGRDLSGLAPDRYPIDGDRIFAILEDVTTEKDKLRFELHRRYTDIQFIVSGREKQLYAHEPGGPEGLLEDRLDASDIAFYSAPRTYNAVFLNPGDFTVYLPGELHCPCCAVDLPEPVRKIVFKADLERAMREAEEIFSV